MRIIGITPAGTPSGRFGREVMVVATDSLDDPGAGPLRRIAPLREFWGDPASAIAQPDGRVIELGDRVVVPPVLPEARVICIGLNYRDHIAEGSYADVEQPPYPTLFARWSRSLVASDVPVRVPADEAGLDWEGEIAAWVGAPLRDADADTARAAILGYSAFNDLTARIAQKRTSQWILGKNPDDSGPTGVLVTADEAGDLRDGLRLTTRVNGEVVQDSTSDRQIYEAGETLAHISRTLTIESGDILATGTPSGVGYARDPQWLLGPGDIVEVEVERLGIIRTPIAAR